MSVKISVVTICYNAAKVIRPTIESVLAQDYGDYEYIIQDGDSTDETPELIREYEDRFAQKGIAMKYVREPDGGIYDAMNRALSSAEGGYVNYMNAGDCFYDMHVLSKAAQAIAEAEDGSVPVIAYGDCAVYEYGRFYLFEKSYERIREKMPFSHQSAFAPAQFLKDHPFDTSYRYSADYDLLLAAEDEGLKFEDIRTTVCITTADGVSSVNYRDTLIESAKIRRAHGIEPGKEDPETGRMLALKQFVLDHFPVFIKKWIRGMQIKNRGQSFEASIPPWFRA
ncbi:MAG: glycosyltransferase [Lachnospiraceae bacterium]|nr:glycosyltransferase [Lachnospiraceae bacterium]